MFLITNQNNFANVPYPCSSYPKATVKSGGCGPCAVLNCVENMTGLRFKMADWISYVIANGGRINGGTSITAILKALKRDYDFTYDCTNDLATVKAHLKNGGMAVFHGGYGNVFSSAGHYVCLAGVTVDDEAIVLDSGWYSGKYSGSYRRKRVTESGQNGLLYVAWKYVEADKKFKSNQGANYYLVTAPKKEEKPVEEDKEVEYKTINDVPAWARPSVEKRVKLGGIADPNNMRVYDSNLIAWICEDKIEENSVYKEIKDVPDYWREDVQELVDAGIVKGNGTYTVYKTHSELAAIIAAKRYAESKHQGEE